VVLSVLRAQGLSADLDVPPSQPAIDFMPVVVSLVLLGAALWVILSRRYDDAAQKWAIATVGSIVGYWLHTGT
jgi:hypothetical protein